jgi:hypothetical protein
LSEEALFDRVVGRLRMLVPRELHNAGELSYFNEKLVVCVAAGLLERIRPSNLIATGQMLPAIRYPDGVVRPYTLGLEDAKDRISADDGKLRNLNFDVMRLIPTVAARAKSEDFHALVESMKLHGYVKSLVITEGADGTVIDGRARAAAAAVAEVKPSTNKQFRLPTRLDTPLQRLTLALDLNRHRINSEQRQDILERVAAKLGRPWSRVEHDLQLTCEWRLVTPVEYDADFRVVERPFRPDGATQVVVSSDSTQIGLRSALLAAGLKSYDDRKIKRLTHTKMRKTDLTGTRPALFADVAGTISAIELIQEDIQSRGRTANQAWQQLREWLAVLGGEPAPEANGVGRVSSSALESLN